MKIDYFVYNRRSMFEPFLASLTAALQGKLVNDLVLHNQGSNLVFEIVYTDNPGVEQQIFVKQKNSLEDLKTEVNSMLDLHKSSSILVRTANITDSNRYVAAVIVQSVPKQMLSEDAEPVEPKVKARQNKKGSAQPE